MTSVAIIGGGVIGCWLALELSQYEQDIFVFEKNPAMCKGENQSSRNSGVAHAGIYYDKETRPLKAKLCVEGNRLWQEFCLRYDLPFKKTGKLIVATDESEDLVLDKFLQRANHNGVSGVTKISGEQARDLEPNMHCYSALLLPTSGIFDPFSLVYKVYTLAANAGVHCLPMTEVIGLKSAGKEARVRIRYTDGAEDIIYADWVINAAGVYACNIAKIINPGFSIRPALIRGDSFKFYRTRRPDIYVGGMNIYPVPIVMDTPSGPQNTVGVHLTPTLEKTGEDWRISDTVTVGPKLVPITHFEDYQTPVPPPETFLRNMTFFPSLTSYDLDPHQSGVQARLDGYYDYYIRRDNVCPQVIHLIGIDSPGFTSAPAIARYVVRMMNQR